MSSHRPSIGAVCVAALTLSCGSDHENGAPQPNPDAVKLVRYRSAMADCLRAHPAEATAAIRRGLERPDEFRPNLSGHFDEGTAGGIIDEIGGNGGEAQFETAPDGTDVVRIQVTGVDGWPNPYWPAQPCDRQGLVDVLCVKSSGLVPAQTDGGTPKGPEAVQIGHAFLVSDLSDASCKKPLRPDYVEPCDFATEEAGGHRGSEIDCATAAPSGAADGGR